MRRHPIIVYIKCGHSDIAQLSLQLLDVTSRHVQDVITRTDKSSDKAGPEAEPLDVEWLCEEEDVVKSRQ